MSSKFLFKIHGLRVIDSKGRALYLKDLQRIARETDKLINWRLKKTELAKTLQRYFAALCIAIIWRRHIGRLIDPISLDKPDIPIYYHRRENGHVTHYGLKLLVQYLLSSTSFCEPVSNLPFSDQELERIDAQARDANLGTKSVLEYKYSGRLNNERQRQTLVTILEIEIGQGLDRVLEDMERYGFPNRIQDMLGTLLELYVIDRESGKTAIRHCLETVRSAERLSFAQKQFLALTFYAMAEDL